MELNADTSRVALVHGGSIDWVQSPAPGVERRMLFRRGGERAIATSIVRYAPGSSFPAHEHPGGEEFLVLDGTFEDEYADYPVGSYVRNPPGTLHAPRSHDGCVIFVRLRQFPEGDTRQVRDIPHAATPFAPRHLFDGRREHVALARWDRGAHLQTAAHEGIELLVLRGELRMGHDLLVPWSWLRLPSGALFSASAGADGCTVWIRTATAVFETDAFQQRA